MSMSDPVADLLTRIRNGQRGCNLLRIAIDDQHYPGSISGSDISIGVGQGDDQD